MFSSISGWILSIAGVVCLSVVVELILPDGSINKYIRSIFSFVIVLVIIAPLPSLIGKNFSFEKLESGGYSIQEEYLHQNNIYKVEALQNDISQQIKKCGYEGVEIAISSQTFSDSFKIKAIYVELQNLVITDKSQHKNINDIKRQILEIVLSVTGVSEKEVHFEG